jgi:hypothetical protein
MLSYSLRRQAFAGCSGCSFPHRKLKRSRNLPSCIESAGKVAARPIRGRVTAVGRVVVGYLAGLPGWARFAAIRIGN